MKMVENGVGKSLYKIELQLIKIIPFIIACFYFTNTVLSYYNIDLAILSKRRDPNSGELVKLTPFTKEEVDRVLNVNKVTINNNQLCDYLYVANMCKADFLGSSITDEKHLALYIKDVIDDPDAYDGIVFNRWYADTRRNGIAIDWEEML